MLEMWHAKHKTKSKLGSVAVDEATVEERGRTLTTAEAQAERVCSQHAMQHILARAEKSHKERTLAFNAALAALPDHFNIPKIS